MTSLSIYEIVMIRWLLVFDPQLRTMSSSRSYRRTLLLIALAASLAVGSSVASGSESLKKALVVSVRVPSRPD